MRYPSAVFMVIDDDVRCREMKFEDGRGSKNLKKKRAAPRSRDLPAHPASFLEYQLAGQATYIFC